MLEILDQVLTDEGTPEVRAVLEETFELFEAYELTDYELAFNDLVLTSDNSEASTRLAQIVDLVERMQDNILAQFQVTLSETATARQANAVLRTIKLIESTELNEEINLLCAEAVDPEEALCEIVALLNGDEAENWFEVIEEVSQAFIDKVREICGKAMDDKRAVLDHEQVTKALGRLTRFREFIQQDILIYQLILEERANLLIPFADYYDLMIQGLRDADLKSESMAMQLYAATMVSSDSADCPAEAIQEQLNKTFASADQITPVIVHLRDLMIRFNSYLTSGVEIIERKP